MFANLFGARYRFNVRDGVLLAEGRSILFQVKWRGFLLLGPKGQRHRVPVYWLGRADWLREEHWDCYYEDELEPISALPF